MGQFPDLLGNGDVRDHAAEGRDQLADVEKAVIAIPAQWGDVENHSKSLLHPLDVGTGRLELFLDLFVTPVEMIDAIDDRLAFGDESGQYEGSAGSQIRGD